MPNIPQAPEHSDDVEEIQPEIQTFDSSFTAPGLQSAITRIVSGGRITINTPINIGRDAETLRYYPNPEDLISLSDTEPEPDYPPPNLAGVFPPRPCREGDIYVDEHLHAKVYYKQEYNNYMATKSKQPTETISCANCNHATPGPHALFTIDNMWICSRCADADFSDCAKCGKLTFIDRLTTIRGRIELCANCVKNHSTKCPECGKQVPKKKMDSKGMKCEWCVESLADSDDNHSYRINKEYRSTSKGNIIKSIRPFGVEIETQYDISSDQPRELMSSLPSCVNIGSDGSIKGNGIELRTPVLSGDKGEKLIAMICDSLKAYKFKVDSSCGMHVHLDAADIPQDDSQMTRRCIKQIFMFYMAFEDVLLSFLPKSRRGSRFCFPLRDSYNIKEVSRANTVGEMEKIWYRSPTRSHTRMVKQDTKHETRYHGINMHTLLAFRHIEIRFHSGTINSKKINEWVNLHALILDKMINQSLDTSTFTKINSIIDIDEKTKIFFEYVPLSEESKNYFLTRQELFNKQEKPSIDEKIRKTTSEILSAEKEA